MLNSDKTVELWFCFLAGPRSALGSAPDSAVPGLLPGSATYFPFFFRCLKKGRCQILAKVSALSTGPEVIKIFHAQLS